MDGSDIGAVFGVIMMGLFSLAVLGGGIALIVFLIKKSSDKAKQAELMVNQMVQQLPSDKQMVFLMQYNAAKKNPTTAVLLALFLGGLGIHKFYMGQTGLGVLYLLFFWTYIPSVIALIEAFVIAGQVAQYNQQKATEIVAMIGGTGFYR